MRASFAVGIAAIFASLTVAACSSSSSSTVSDADRRSIVDSLTRQAAATT
jgi:hypothetical protein